MLNISRQIYTGWGTVTSNSLPMAEVIPAGESSNEKKRLATFTSRHAVVKEYENVPLPGFTLSKAKRRSWSSHETDWIVIDPRGFTMKISTANLEQILHVTGITEGLIQEKCVWARENSETKMMLVPITSPLYVEAVKNTELIEGKISVKDVNIGDKVLLQNKLEGIFLGTVSLYGSLYESSEELKPQVMLRRQVIMVGTDKFHYQTDAKILKVTKKVETPMTKEEACALMNASIATGNAYFTNTTYLTGRYYSSHGRIKFVSPHAVPKPELILEEVDELEANKLWHDSEAITDVGMLVLENASGTRFLVDHYAYYGNSQKDTIHSFAVSPIVPMVGTTITSLVLRKSDHNGYGYGRNSKPKTSLDKFTKFYKIMKNVKGTTYL